VEHIAKVTGIPFIRTNDLSVAVNYGMILSSSLFANNKFSSEEINQLETYVTEGGLLVAPRIEESDFFPLFGIEGFEKSNSRFAIHWDTTLSDASLKYIDQPEEQTLPLGRDTYDAIYKTVGYTTTTAQTVWKNTSPGNSKATLMVSHDIDSKTGMDTLQVFVDYEAARNIEATYNMTVRYFDDELMGPYYLGGQSTLNYILNHGHGSRSSRFVDTDFSLWSFGVPQCFSECIR